MCAMATVAISEQYRPRQVSDLGIFENDGWRLKVTGIAYRGAAPRKELVDATARAARAILPHPAVSPERYGTGFIGVHDGRGACFCFVDWWESENELHHRTLVAPQDSPSELRETTGSGFVACAWDLALICHERQAWVDCVLANPEGPDLDAYLRRRLMTPV